MSNAHDAMKKKMELLGIEPKKSLGQNFLVSDHVIGKICDAVETLKPDTLYEIGPGLGALTTYLKQKHQFYHVIELDRVFAEHWRTEGLQVIESDALHLRWDQLPQQGRRILVSNLPYQISSTLVIDRSLDENPLDGMILMFQKEVAQRIRAKPQTPDYSLLSVVAQMAWDIEMLLEASSRDFSPPPKVASRVLIFKPKKSPVHNRKKFLKFVKGAFLHRRKLLINNLVTAMGTPHETLEKAFLKLKIAPKARAEELNLQQMIDLFQELGYDQAL